MHPSILCCKEYNRRVGRDPLNITSAAGDWSYSQKYLVVLELSTFSCRKKIRL